jgi:chromosome segregation ATPase
MLKKLEIGEHTSIEDGQQEIRQKIESTLCKLKELKERVAELKRRCEELRTMESQRVEKAVHSAPRCDKCGHALDPVTAVVIRDANGEERRHYHQGCFKTLFK